MQKGGKKEGKLGHARAVQSEEKGQKIGQKRAVQNDEKGLQTKVKRGQRRRRRKGKPNKAMGGSLKVEKSELGLPK